MADEQPTRMLPRPGEPAGEDPLLGRLAEEMAGRWRAGEPVRAEDYLSRYPELRDRPEDFARLLRHEFALRRQAGEAAAPPGPPVWEAADEFRVLATLGQGGEGQVLLATQPALADRPVVLKITACRGKEHLSLARLQHTHIVPLYWAHDEPGHDRRTLCMPFFGTVTLGSLLGALQDTPVARRSGARLVEVLDRANAAAAVILPARGPARTFLARAGYVEAVCWLGACLAEALHYAHERNVVHLDLKPSNVLLAADGQPMLLDFHLAQEPIDPGRSPPPHLGGTPKFMSPEQEAVIDAVQKRRPLPCRVDGRSDLYSLGLMLYEALADALPRRHPPGPAPLHRLNPAVSVGLSDVVHKCLALHPEGRYAYAGALATDLRRHLNHLPLVGVRNRSAAERWRKWRRRRPAALALLGLGAGVLLAALVLGEVALETAGWQRRQAQAALEEGRRQMQRGEYSQAVATLQRGKGLARGLLAGGDLERETDRHLRRARRAQEADQLHSLAERLRTLYGASAAPPGGIRGLAASWRAVWDRREGLRRKDGTELAPDAESRLETDLRDLGVLWADLRVRWAGPGEASAAHREALRVMDEAEALCGPSLVLCRLREASARALGRHAEASAAGRAAEALSPRTAWDHYALGRFLLLTGDPNAAAEELDRAVALRPDGYWPNFYQGVCAFRRQRYAEAAAAFRVCVALAPANATAYFNRGMAEAALGRQEEALEDYTRALTIDPRLGAAALNRGLLHLEHKNYRQAEDDLRLALGAGCDPATVRYNLALVRLAWQDRAGALASVREALRADPHHPQAAALLERLRR